MLRSSAPSSAGAARSRLWSSCSAACSAPTPPGAGALCGPLVRRVPRPLGRPVQPDYSIEMIFPRFDRSRVDYDRFKKDFPFEDAHAIVVVEAPDLFTPAGLRRVSALEQALAEVPGVVDTQGLTTVKDVVA